MGAPLWYSSKLSVQLVVAFVDRVVSSQKEQESFCLMQNMDLTFSKVL